MTFFLRFFWVCVLALSGTCAAQSFDMRVRTITDDVFAVQNADLYLMTRACDVRTDTPIGARLSNNQRELLFESGKTCRLHKRLTRFTPSVGRHPSKISHNYDGVYTFWSLKWYAISTTQTVLTMGADGALVVNPDLTIVIDYDGLILPVSLVLKQAP